MQNFTAKLGTNRCPLQCPFCFSVMASIMDSKVSKNWQRGKKINEIIHDRIRGDSETIPELFNWDFWRISLTKSDSRPFPFFLSKLMKYCLSWFVLMGKEGFWREIKNVAWGKTSPFEWFYKSYSCLLNTTVILTHTLKARQKQNNNNKLHTMIWFSLHLQRHRGSLLTQLHMLQCRRKIFCGSTSNRHFWTTKIYRHCKLSNCCITS